MAIKKQKAGHHKIKVRVLPPFVVKKVPDFQPKYNSQFPTFLHVFLIAAMVLGLAGLSPASSKAAVENPVLSQACGLDIALVIDSSGSINSTELGQMKTAYHSFVDAFLPGTPTQFSVTDFDTIAHTPSLPFTSNSTLINNAINAPLSGGNTNWEDGLLKAQNTFDPRPGSLHPNLIIFASDGNPNEIGNPGQFTSTSTALAHAVAVADSIKAGGTRILALGIGVGADLNIENLKAISGPNVDIGDTSDVITTNFSSLAEDLAALAESLCGGTITITKVVDQDGDLQTTEDQDNGGLGWSFGITGQADQATEDNGQTAAVSVNNGVYSITETQNQAGYSLAGAVCSGAADNGIGSENGITGLVMDTDNIITCTFYNRPNPGTLTVIKNVVNGFGGTASASDFNINVTGGSASPASFAGSETGVEVTVASGGQYTVLEDVASGYATGYSEDCTGTMPLAGTKTCTVTNTQLDPNAGKGSITVIKSVTNDNGGTAEPGDFVLKVNGTVVSSGASNFFDPGDYTVSEDAKDGYVQTSINCLNGDLATEDGSVSLAEGQSVTCTIVNNDQPANLIVKKVVSGGDFTANSFSFVVNNSVTPVSVEADGENQLTIDAGTYTVTELAASGYVASYSNCSDIQLAVGQTQTCTITNTFQSDGGGDGDPTPTPTPTPTPDGGGGPTPTPTPTPDGGGNSSGGSGGSGPGGPAPIGGGGGSSGPSPAPTPAVAGLTMPSGGGSNPPGEVLGESTTLPRTGVPVSVMLLALATATAVLNKKLKLI